MSILTRNDGVQFVLQVYRESFSLTERPRVLRQIRQIAEQQGAYLGLFNKDDRQLEVVFSPEPGYLLGESVWDYFRRPENLIFCEALPDSEDVVLVIIRDHRVYLDTQIEKNFLRSELLPLMSDERSYQIVVSGSTGLTKAPQEEGFCFPEDQVESFMQLPKSLLPRLKISKNLRLQPLKDALRSEYLRQPTSLLIVAVVALIAVMGVVWSVAPKERLLSHLKPQTAYGRAMHAPDLGTQLNELATHINTLYFVPGWHAQSVSYDGHRYAIHLIAAGGNLNTLASWARANQFRYRLDSEGAQLSRQSHLAPRANVSSKRSLQGLLATLHDELGHLLPSDTVTVGNVYQVEKDLKTASVMIRMQDVSPQILELVGSTLADMPVVLSRVNLKLQSGLLSGTIRLSAWGI